MKYYLCFLFTPDGDEGLHCTHCYFGEQPPGAPQLIISIVEKHVDYFGPIQMRRVLFNVPDLFGPDKNIKVLTTHDTVAFMPMASLRDTFEDMGMLKGVSTIWAFNPHVTTDKHTLIRAPFVRYALIGDGKIIKSWPIVERKS